jgi:hypothetical protein
MAEAGIPIVSDEDRMMMTDADYVPINPAYPGVKKVRGSLRARIFAQRCGPGPDRTCHVATPFNNPSSLSLSASPLHLMALQMNTVPPIYVVENFLTPEECDLLIETGRAGLKRSIVVDGKAGKVSAPSRTSESCYLQKEKTVWLADKINALTGKPQSTHEPPQVARYLLDQYYLPHFDAFDLTTGPGRECANPGAF